MFTNSLSLSHFPTFSLSHVPGRPLLSSVPRERDLRTTPSRRFLLQGGLSPIRLSLPTTGSKSQTNRTVPVVLPTCLWVDSLLERSVPRGNRVTKVVTWVGLGVGPGRVDDLPEGCDFWSQSTKDRSFVDVGGTLFMIYNLPVGL